MHYTEAFKWVQHACGIFARTALTRRAVLAVDRSYIAVCHFSSVKALPFPHACLNTSSKDGVNLGQAKAQDSRTGTAHENGLKMASRRQEEHQTFHYCISTP